MNAELIRRACAGDFTAASELIAGHYEAIYAYFRRLCHSEHDAADLTQKTFSKVWQSLHSYSGRSTFKTWLHSIAHHVYVDWRRKPDRLQAQLDQWWESCPADGPSPFDAAVERDSSRRVYAAVEQLDEEQRETIHLHYYQGLTINETAEALGVATSTVKYRLRTGLDRLHSRLAEPNVPA